jgi:hypothetical protein
MNRSTSHSRTRSQEDSRETHQHGDGRSRPRQAVHAAQGNGPRNPHGTAPICLRALGPSGGGSRSVPVREPKRSSTPVAVAALRFCA